MMRSERIFSVNGYQLAANEWHRHAEHKVIALHGWLDNCASFDVLAPLLTDCHIVALDSPGHGLSDHKSPQATYNIWDDLLDILAVADVLEWETFTLLGHSRGAIMSLLLAATARQRVERIVLLDGIWPQPVRVEDTAKQLRQFLDSNRAKASKPSPVYASIDEAVDVRCKAASMAPASARLIVERGLCAVGKGFSWRADPRLLTASAVKLTADHQKSIMRAIRSPIMLLIAEQGMGANVQFMKAVQKYKKIHYQTLPGSHHFHMEQQASDIAHLITMYIEQPQE